MPQRAAPESVPVAPSASYSRYENTRQSLRSDTSRNVEWFERFLASTPTFISGLAGRSVEAFSTRGPHALEILSVPEIGSSITCRPIAHRHKNKILACSNIST